MKKFLIFITVISTIFLIPDNSHAQLTGGWTIQYENAYLQDIKFLNENTGITVGYLGKILKTTNSGNNWTSVNSGTIQNLNSVSISETTCFIAGDLGVILKSSDQGDTWIILSSGTTSNLHSIVFQVPDICFAAGENGTLLRSTSSGLSWTETFADPSVSFTSLSFVNERNVWAVGQKSNLGFMIKTSNLGANWINVIPDIEKHYKGKSILFLDSLKGYCGFCSTVAQWGFLVTTNGGATWDCSQAGFGSPTSIFFVNDSFGVCVQDMNPSIWIYNSTSWNFSSVPFLPPILTSAFFINSSTGWVAGNKLLKTTNGGGLLTNVNNISENIPKEFSLSQNFPNPFNPATKIKFDIQKTSFTKLSVYNSEGKMIETLYNGQLNGGSYEINFDGSSYPSGIYFYKLETDEYSFSKKMLLVK